MTCRYCKHFDTQEPHSDITLKHVRGYCRSVKVVSDHSVGWFHNDKYPDVNAPDCLFAECDENRSSLTVGPDFGCIHWEGS